jgi:hypothetical protein
MVASRDARQEFAGRSPAADRSVPVADDPPVPMLEPVRFRDLVAPFPGFWPWMLRIDLPDGAKGRIGAEQLEVIGDHPGALALWVTGLNQASFDQVITRCGSQLLAIKLDKCPLIADLSPLENLPRLRLADIRWNQRATGLWDLSRHPGLTGLKLRDFTRLHNLNELPAGTSLRELTIGDAVWPTSTYETLEPLTRLPGLRTLALNPKRIDDNRIEPLGALTWLEELDIPTSMFTTRQFAWLRARLPDTVTSPALAPVIDVTPSEDNGKIKDTLLVGKRKPYLSSATDQARITRHIDDYWHMVSEFQRNPTLLPS